MVIFHSYVKLPEGIWYVLHMLWMYPVTIRADLMGIGGQFIFQKPRQVQH